MHYQKIALFLANVAEQKVFVVGVTQIYVLLKIKNYCLCHLERCHNLVLMYVLL